MESELTFLSAFYKRAYQALIERKLFGYPSMLDERITNPKDPLCKLNDLTKLDYLRNYLWIMKCSMRILVTDLLCNEAVWLLGSAHFWHSAEEDWEVCRWELAWALYGILNSWRENETLY